MLERIEGCKGSEGRGTKWAGRRWLQAILTLHVFLISVWLPSCKQQLFSVNSKQSDNQKFSSETRRFSGVCLFSLTVWLVDFLLDTPSGLCARNKMLF